MQDLSKLRRRGVTLAELIVAFTVLTLVTSLGHIFLGRSMEGLKRVSERSQTRKDLAKLSASLRNDVEAMSAADISVKTARTSLTGLDGDALWGLSARDLDGKFHLLPDGKPFWQNQILYYPSIPSNYQDGRYRGTGLAKDGYEVSYPFKRVIRQVLDTEDPADPIDPATIEALSPTLDIESYMQRPADLQIPLAPETLRSQVIVSNILEFKVTKETDGSVQFKLAGYAPETKPKRFSSSDLTVSPHTCNVVLRLYPKQSLSL